MSVRFLTLAHLEEQDSATAMVSMQLNCGACSTSAAVRTKNLSMIYWRYNILDFKPCSQKESFSL